VNLSRANTFLAVAAVVLAVPTWLTIRSEATTFVDVAHVPRLFEGFDPEQVATVVLGAPQKEQPAPPPNQDPNQKPPIQYDTLSIQRTDKGFVLGQGMGDLTGAPIKRELLELQVLKHLSEIRADRDAMVRPDATDEQLAEYGLDPEHAFIVKAGNAERQVIAELLVGKDTASGKGGGTDTVRGVFLRRGDSRDVVLYEVPYWNRQLKPDVWLDVRLLTVPGDQVRAVSLKNKTGTIEFTRPKGQASWRCDAPPEGRAAVRQVEVEGLVQRFGYLQASQFLKSMAAAAPNLNAWGLEPAQLEIKITYDKDDQQRTAVIGVGVVVEGKSENYLRSSESQFAMTIGSNMVTPYEKPIGEFFDPKAPAPENGKDETKDDKGADKGDKKDDVVKDAGGGTPTADGSAPAATAPADAQQAPKAGAVKPDAGKPDAGKPEAVKPEAAKPDAAKPEAAKPEAPKPDAPKPEPPKPQPAPDAARPGGGRGGKP
jgi:hypothetical protein